MKKFLPLVLKKTAFIGWCLIAILVAMLFWAWLLHWGQNSLIDLRILSPLDQGDEWHPLFGGLFLVLSPITAYLLIIWGPKYLDRYVKKLK